MTAVARPLRISRWVGAPLLACLALSLVLATPIRVLGLPLPEPVTLMAPAFAWGVIRPALAPAFALLLGGLALEALWGAPTGLWAMSLLAGYLPVLALRNVLAGQSNVVLWAWYGVTCLIAQGVGWLIAAGVTGSRPALVATGLQWLSTVLLFPFAAWLIARFRDADVRFR
jgi:rod shape-determining protein MreD